MDIVHNPSHQSAHYEGLMTCGSVWNCPVCAARVAEKRREELERAIEKCQQQGGTVWMATFTVKHEKDDSLGDLLRTLEAAMRRMRQGRSAQALKKQFDVIGTVTVREVTYGEHGWHPHMHQLIFFRGEIDEEEFDSVMRKKWANATKHEGLETNEHGFRLDKTYGQVAKYVTKLGRDTSEYEHPGNWNAASEMTRTSAKQGCMKSL